MPVSARPPPYQNTCRAEQERTGTDAQNLPRRRSLAVDVPDRFLVEHGVVDAAPAEDDDDVARL